MADEIINSVTDSADVTCRYFVTYTGIKLPLRLITPLDPADIKNRNTYMRAYFDASERMTVCQKIVYGEVELEHRYQYHDNGVVKQVAVQFAGEDAGVMCFDEEGGVLAD